MLYCIIGILMVLAVHLVMFLKCYEHNMKINKKHMIWSVLFSIYVVYVIEALQDYSMKSGKQMFMVVLLFLPFGTIMPIIYQRFKYFLINVLYVFLVNLCLVGLQLIRQKEVSLLVFVFSLFGLLLGFGIGCYINQVIPELRKNLIIKKRKSKKQIISISYEAEIMIVCLFALFFCVAGIERISGKNLEEQIKGTVQSDNVQEDKYASVYYAEKDKYDRYDRYAKLHSEFDIEEVVWRVNANLDQKFYDEDYVTIADKNTDEPLLLNKFNRVSEGFEPKRLVKIEGNYEATPETQAAYKELVKDLEKEGMKIYIVSAYRSISYQESLYNHYLKTDSKQEVDTYSSRPGYSEHHTGRALDISQVQGNLDAFEGSDEAEWVYENAYKYGFIVRYREEQMDVTGYIFEPWHITYVGKEISMKMHEENIETLEEYVVKYVDHQKE